jgi:CBS domain-containing protein
MLATVIADLVFSAVNEDSLMTEKLTRRGLRLGRHYGVDPFATTSVAAIMTTPVETIPVTATAGEARKRLAVGDHSAYPVVDGDAVVGIVARGDLLRADEGEDDRPVLDVATREVVTVRSGDRAQDVLTAMLTHRVEHVPVVEDGVLVGICTRTVLVEVRRGQLALERPQPGRLRASR